VLFDGYGERVILEDWQPGAIVDVENHDGLELLVLAGGFTESGDTLNHWTWLRVPAGQPIHAQVGNEGGSRLDKGW
jgi:hypothetical protein